VPSEKPPRKWTLEGERVEELLALYTRWEKEGDRVARYRFWTTIIEIFPEVKEIEVYFDEDSATQIVIIEGKDPEDEE